MSAPQVPRTLRVLQIDAGRAWRGGERQLLLLAEGLRARGVEPLVAALPGSPLLQRLKSVGIATAALAMRSAFDLLALRRLRRLIGTWRPHVVHAHDPRSHALALAALVGRRRATPLVVTSRIAKPPRGIVRRGSRVAHFIAISGAVRDALLAGHIDAGRTSLIYPGVSTRLPAHPRNWRAECDWPESTVVAGVVGPITRSRSGSELARLVQNLRPAVGDQLSLVLLGGPAAGRTTIGGLRAFRAGFVHDIPHALAGLDVLLHPGGAEGLGTAVIEGMALGVPTIAFAVGGMAEVIEHEHCGLLVPVGDDVQFANAVARVVADPTLRATLGAAGPARAARFDPEDMVTATLGIYRDLLARSGV